MTKKEYLARNRQPAREAVRNSGLLQGRLDGLLPAFYLCQHEAHSTMLENSRAPRTPGMFALGEPGKPTQPNAQLRMGLLLPLRFCRDVQARQALQAVAVEMEKTDTPMSARRQRVQAMLDKAFLGDLQVRERESLDGFCALKRSPGLIRLLHESFDYVSCVTDNPQGMVRVGSLARFHWQSWAELMDWHQSQCNEAEFQDWPMLRPMLLSRVPQALHAYHRHHRARAGLWRPEDPITRWFTLRPNVPDAKLGIRLEMHEAGWATLHMALDGVWEDVSLSEIYDPFDQLSAWGREIKEGNLPIGMDIDEEGSLVKLIALPTGNPERVLLRVMRKCCDDRQEVLLEGIVQRRELGEGLRTELSRFFSEDFNPMHWELRCYSDYDEYLHSPYPEDHFITRTDSIMSSPWLAPRGQEDSS